MFWGRNGVQERSGEVDGIVLQADFITVAGSTSQVQNKTFPTQGQTAGLILLTCERMGRGKCSEEMEPRSTDIAEVDKETLFS